MIIAGLMGALSAAGATPTVAWSGISYTSVDEGVQNTVSLNLTNWDGSQIYWFLTDGSSQLSSGQVTPATNVLSPGTGNSSQSFNFTFNNDVTTDGPLYYYVRIENEAGALLIPQQGVFTCNDTSQDNAGLMFQLDTANDVISGVWVDSSGKSRNASMYFLDAYSADNGGVYVFNGSSTFATVPSLQNSAYTSISLSAWVKPSSTSTDTIVAKELCYKLRINADGSVQWYVGPGSGWDVNLQTSAGVITADTWYHIVATVDATAAKIYINGNMVATTSGTTIGVNNQPLVIGAYTYNTTTDDFFGGRIGEVKMWNYALNAPNIETEFTTTNSRYNPPSYTWGSYDTTGDEGGTLTVNVNTANVANGTTLYWNVVLGSTISSGDFASTSGSFSINSNTGSFAFDLASDTLTEGSELFTVQVRTVSNSGTVVLTSNQITIGDTSAGNRAPIAYLFNGSGSYTVLDNNVYSDISNLAYQDSNFIDIAKGSYPTPQAGWSYRPLTFAAWNTIASVSDNGSYWNIELSPGGTGSALDTGQLTDNINADWALGTTWTIEFWVKPTVVPGRNGAPNTPQRILSQNTDLNVQNNNGYNNIDVCFTQGIIAFANQYAGFDAPAEMVGVWSHVAISSAAGNVKGFINGVQVYNYGGLNVNFTNGVADLYIGKNGTRASPNVNSFDGLLTDIRISNTARYTSAFNPATALAPTMDSNTKLLLTPKQDSWYGSAARKLGYNNFVTVDYPTTYTVAPVLGGTNVDEGSGITFEVGGTNITDGTYYWTIETNSGDFATTSGAITMTSNAGTFIATPRADASISEGSETFTVAVRSGSISGTILVTSDPVTINDTSVAVAPFSLALNSVQSDYVSVASSSDWLLGTTWTIEFWMKANSKSTTEQTLLSQFDGGNDRLDVYLSSGFLSIDNGRQLVAEPTVGGAAYSISNPSSQGGWGDGTFTGLATTGGTGTGLTVDGTTTGGYLGTPTINNPGSGYSTGDTITVTGPGGGSATFTISATTQGVWTHVAMTCDGAGGGSLNVYYNGALAHNGAGYNLGMSGAISVGRRGTGNYQYFDGNLAMIRISNAVKYATDFTPATTYGVEADTKLFLGSDTPLDDTSASDHTITNNGVTLTTAFPHTYTVRQWLGGYTGGGTNSSLIVLLADYPAAASIPTGATVVIGGVVKTVLSNMALDYNNTGTPCRQFTIESGISLTRGDTVTFTW